VPESLFYTLCQGINSIGLIPARFKIGYEFKRHGIVRFTVYGSRFRIEPGTWNL
jgi:hypothetical protein